MYSTVKLYWICMISEQYPLSGCYSGREITSNTIIIYTGSLLFSCLYANQEFWSWDQFLWNFGPGTSFPWNFGSGTCFPWNFGPGTSFSWNFGPGTSFPWNFGPRDQLQSTIGPGPKIHEKIGPAWGLIFLGTNFPLTGRAIHRCTASAWAVALNKKRAETRNFKDFKGNLPNVGMVGWMEALADKVHEQEEHIPQHCYISHNHIQACIIMHKQQ